MARTPLFVFGSAATDSHDGQMMPRCLSPCRLTYAILPACPFSDGWFLGTCLHGSCRSDGPIRKQALIQLMIFMSGGYHARVCTHVNNREPDPKDTLRASRDLLRGIFDQFRGAPGIFQVLPHVWRDALAQVVKPLPISMLYALLLARVLTGATFLIHPGVTCASWGEVPLQGGAVHPLMPRHGQLLFRPVQFTEFWISPPHGHLYSVFTT